MNSQTPIGKKLLEIQLKLKKKGLLQRKVQNVAIAVMISQTLFLTLFLLDPVYQTFLWVLP